ncbi:PQQ-binding-like beta-propeller repeat protein [Nocardia uniformis]|uniref:PQQ-binding-like beta-propeller repeat protein n=1 Tax=Nocardia uniformis TaxID=53432 RepID=A0A849CFV0_9NOCA|nr:PQQ-binding-like beta-propeller repeat protein [Nocardia uniformis]NNH72311.1 PQQ-binding-like beta-propeller repeat protein [Nocardia uniformis]
MASLGFGLLVGAVALGLYSLFIATTVPLSDSHLRNGGVTWRLEEVGGIVVVAGGLLLVLTAVAFWRGRRSTGTTDPEGKFENFATGTVVVTVMALAFIAFDARIPTIFADIRSDYPYFSRLPTAVAAFVLVAAGALLVLGLLPRMTNAALVGYRPVATAVVVGLGLSTAVGFAAVRAGDDSVNLDHATATAADPLPTPDRLGPERYRVVIPPTEKDPDRFITSSTQVAPNIVRAGTGFVIGTRDGLTAYDGNTGRERWHYRRLPRDGELRLPYAANSLRSLDNGTVVLAVWRGIGYRAFDAITGELLWTESEFTRDNSAIDWSTSSHHRNGSLPGLLILASETRIARYDARTGTREWISDIDGGECPGFDRNRWNPHSDDAHTANAVYRLLHCERDDQSWIQIQALDTGTGAAIGTRDIARGPLEHERTSNPLRSYPDMERLENTLVIDWKTRESGPWHLLVDHPSHLVTAPIRQPGTPFGADPEGSEVAVGTYGARYGDGYADVIAADSDTLVLPIQEMDLWSAMPKRVVFLRDELLTVLLDPSRTVEGPQVGAWDRTDGRFVGMQPIGHGRERCDSITLLPVPSALLAICAPRDPTRSETTIIGYTR